MLIRYSMHNNPKLAEQLMFGSSNDKVTRLNEKLWKKFDGNRFDYYLNIVKICGIPITARARYVIAMAYAWNSSIYCKKTIYYLELYLSKPLYRKLCVSNDLYSAKTRTNLHLSEMYNYLGQAYLYDKNIDMAIQSYKKSIKYSPYRITPYLRIAEIYGRQKKFDKSISILEQAYNSKYARITTDEIPGVELYIDKNVVYTKILEYKEKLYIENTYPYNQKEVRKQVNDKLSQINININLTQPKLKIINDYFNLKNNQKYFYKYPDSEIYRCSKELVDLLVNSFENNPHLIDDIKNKKTG